MDSSNDSSTHDKAMETLCFVCGYVMKKDDRFYLVGEWSDFLAKALRCSEVFELPGITPTKFCFGCYTNLGHIARVDVQSRHIKQWKTGVNVDLIAMLANVFRRVKGSILVAKKRYTAYCF